MPTSKIPDRWEAYSKMGKVILGTAIMPIKTPLRESLTSSLSPEERFSPSTLLHLLQKENLKLSGLVDLTNTTRYYDSQFFTENGIGYRKIFTAGRVIPDNKTYNQFASAIKEMEKEGEVTCVHCTHGLNRSGYLICRYMIEFLNIEPQKAIKLFEDARGYKMERSNYVDDLMTRKPGDPGNDRYSHESSVNPNNFRSHQNYQGNEGMDYGRRVDYGRQGYRNDDRGWNHRNGQRGRGYKSHDTWNRDGLQWNHGAGNNFRQNAVDHRLDGGYGSRRNEGRTEAGPSRHSSYNNGGYEQMGGGDSYYRHRQGQSYGGEWQGNGYSSSNWTSQKRHSQGGYRNGATGGWSRDETR